MTDTSQESLERLLATFTVPETDRPLGGPGTSFTVTRTGSGWQVAILCGFPLAHARGDLIDALRVHCAAVAAIEFVVTSEIKAHSVQHGLKPLPGVRNLLAVASGKGGVGKSTVAVNFALALAREGAKVGLLDADIYGPSQPRMLGLMGKRPETRDGKLLEPLVAHGIEAMSIGFLVEDRKSTRLNSSH